MGIISPEKALGVNLVLTAATSALQFAGGVAISHIGVAMGTVAATASAVASGALTSLATAFSMLGFSIGQYLYSKNIISLRTRNIIAGSSLVVGVVATVALAFFVSVNPIHAAALAAGGAFAAGFLLFNFLSENHRPVVS